MVAIAMGIIVGFTLLTLAFFFTAFLVAAWPVFLVLGIWLLVKELRLRQSEDIRAIKEAIERNR